MSAKPAVMFGDEYCQETEWVRVGNPYFATSVQWEVARQMNADWTRLRNQEVTIAQLKSDLAASRSECERYRKVLESVQLHISVAEFPEDEPTAIARVDYGHWQQALDEIAKTLEPTK